MTLRDAINQLEFLLATTGDGELMCGTFPYMDNELPYNSPVDVRVYPKPEGSIIDLQVEGQSELVMRVVKGITEE